MDPQNIDHASGVFAAPLPVDEEARLAAVRRYEILDTPRERGFDEIVALAAQICGAPMALVSLIDGDRQWFKARIGVDAEESPRALAFCAHTILGEEILEIPDAREDPRFADHPLISGPPGLRFYAGAPLITSDGYKLGTICVLDRSPRHLSRSQRFGLEALARQVIALLELRFSDRTLARLLRETHAARITPDEALCGDEGAAEQALLACVTRDLRAPLTAILGIGEALIEDAEAARAADQAASLRAITAAAEHMLTLVGDVVDLARIEGGRLVLHPVRCAPAVLAHDVAAAMEPLASAGGNRIDVVDHGAGMITADATRLRQLLFNLVANACEFTRDGRVTVELDRVHERWLAVSVRDTGVGIDEHLRARLFRPRLLLDDGCAAPGSGLGLVLTRGLCERMGGALAVESAPGAGATFTLWLPTRPPKLAVDAPALLVVEPDPSGRARIIRDLGEGARLTFVDSVRAARERLAERSFAGVLVDAAAPGADRSEFAALCREIEGDDDVVAMISERIPATGRCVVLGPGDDVGLRRFVAGLRRGPSAAPTLRGEEA